MRRADDLLRHLLGISRDFELRLLSALHERGHEGLRPSFGRFLYLVWDEPRPLKVIAQELGISRQAASQTARRVEAAGYAELRPDPADGRSKIVAITPQGRAVDDDRAREAIEKCESRYEAIVGAPALRTFVEALADLRDAMDDPARFFGGPMVAVRTFEAVEASGLPVPQVALSGEVA